MTTPPPKPTTQSRTYNLFVYGTLTDPSVFRAVLGRNLVAEPDQADGVETFCATRAVLSGYKKVSPDETYLYAVPDHGHRIRGYLVRDLPRDTLPALMEYEGKNYRRRTLDVQSSEGTVRAIVFVGNAEQLDRAFGSSFRDPLKQEILLGRKIDKAIREAEEQTYHTRESLTRRAVAELRGPDIRDIQRRHFEAGGISDFAIRQTLRDKPLPDYSRIIEDPRAQQFAPHYLRLLIRQVIFNEFEQRIHDGFRYELDHLPHPVIFYDRIISSLVALRLLNQSEAVLNQIVEDLLAEIDFTSTQLIDYVRRAIGRADALYDPAPAKAHINFIRGHMGFGYIPLGAELEFSNVGHDVIGQAANQDVGDPQFDGFTYFYDFGLDVLTWKLGGHIDDHHTKSKRAPRRGFFEVALGNLSVDANISKPITPDPWILNQLIDHTRRFYPIRPHSIHLSMQPKSQHRPDRNRLLPMSVLQCLLALAGDPVVDERGKISIARLRQHEIIRDGQAPNLLFSEISKRYSAESDDRHPGSGEGTYVQQFRFLRLSEKLNYEPIAMALKGIQLSLRPGTFLTPMQWKRSQKHRETFEQLRDWGNTPEPIEPAAITRFLSHVEDGLMSERRGRPAHSRAYIAWSISLLEESLRYFNMRVGQMQA
jgi:gamma-glutamylcyclotransferase (GGCT)/AIG2-like uncharacterized protein YtfP